MDQTTFDLFQHTGYDYESTFASDALSEKAWTSDDLVTFWESEKDIFPDFGSDSTKMASSCKSIKEEPLASKEPRCTSAVAMRDHSPFSKNDTTGRSLAKDATEDSKYWSLKPESLTNPVPHLGASCIMTGDGSFSKKTVLMETVPNEWDSAADDLFKNDIGIIERKFSCEDDVSLELLLDNYDDGFGSVESLTPTGDVEDVWDASDTLWNEPSSINMETENQILQLLAHVSDMGASMEELSVMCNPSSESAEQHRSLTTNYSDSALNSSADDDDYDDSELDVFDSLEDEPRESFWTDVKPVNISPKNVESDDESEEVDIISVVEEVESPREDTSSTSVPESLHLELSTAERRTLENVRRVTSDHCYCPLVILDWIESAQKPASSKCEKTYSPSRKSVERIDGVLVRRPGFNRRLPLKRGRRKLCDSQGISGSGRSKESRRHGSRSARFFPHSTREKREQLNQMERERRIGLKACFERLRVVVPETALNSKASKDKILLFARSKIRFLEQITKSNTEELARLKKMNDFLHQRLKRAQNVLVC